MKYVDIKLMKKTCDLKNKNLEKDDLRWQECLENYYLYLETIKSRFSKKFYSFFTKTDMHDSILIQFKIIKRHLAERTCIDIETDWKNNNNTFSLTFKDVRKYSTDIDLSEGYCEFGDYIIGEFLEVDANYLSFEFLFYNDSTIYIEFKRLIFKKTGDG